MLRRCRYTLPLQVLSPLTLDDGTSYLLLLNPTGGVLGGDRLRTEITLGENSNVCLSTPSATRIYRTSGAPAEMHTVLRLARGATLEYLPDHVIPHAGSLLQQSLRIEMQEGSRGIFLDAFSSGRVALNEHWRFQQFDSRTEITLRGKPIYLSRTKIIPAPASALGTAPPIGSWPPSPSAATASPVCASPFPPASGATTPVCTPPLSPTSGAVTPDRTASALAEAQRSAELVPSFRGSELQFRHDASRITGVVAPEEIISTRLAETQAAPPADPSPITSVGRMSDYSYSASLVIVADQFPNWRSLIASLRAELDTVPGVIGGISLLSEAGCSARYLAKSAIDLHEATRRLWTAARAQVLNLPPLDLRKY